MISDKKPPLSDHGDKKFSVLAEKLGTAIIIVQDSRCVFANRLALDLSGYSHDELVSKNVADLVHPDQLETVLGRIKRKLDGEEDLYVHKYKIIRKGGESLWVDLQSSLIEFEQRPALLCTAYDLSDSIRAEEELHAARARAEADNRAKDAFLSTMSHEIRTPLNGVIGMTDLLLRTELNREQRQFAELIRSSGNALLSLMNDILDYSKLEAGSLELQPQVFNLADCIESALETAAFKVMDKKLDLACLVDADTPGMIIGDPVRLKQIFSNLLDNAVKFTESGEIVIRAGQAQRFSRDSRDWCELAFTVSDTGTGIPAGQMDLLFEPFSQADSSAARRVGGPGLGLAICRRLVLLMGGKMWAESRIGKGTMVHFTVTAQVADVPGPAYRREEPKLKGKKALIVDDNGTSREVLARQVLAWGMLPVCAESGAAALEQTRKSEPFDIALLDNRMPGMDGPELAKQIRLYSKYKTLPVIIISSPADHKDLRTEELTFPLSKPVKAAELYNAVMEIFVKGFTISGTKIAERKEEKSFDPDTARFHPLRILLAEDNAINRQLALAALEKIGYRADVAVNGIEAVELFKNRDYDIIIMDVQMPEMDGLEATRIIRRDFPRKRQPRIIAMTANAMQGDREMCLESGMDDYISKPFEVEDFIKAILETPGATVIDSSAILNLKSILGPESGKLLPKLIDDFIADSVRLQIVAANALSDGNADILRRAAHTLKSTSASFGAAALSALCKELETAAKSGELTGSEEMLGRIKTEFERAKADLLKIREGLS